MILFRASRCVESGEDTEALNFTSKIAPESARIELGTSEIPEAPMSTLGARRRRHKAEKGERSIDEEGLLDVMNKVAESMTAEISEDNDYSMKRSRLDEQRKAQIESLRKTFSQKRQLHESGLPAEDPEVTKELDLEIKCCKDRLGYFRKKEEELMQFYLGIVSPNS